MNVKNLKFFPKIIQFLDKEVTFRLYGLEKDDQKLVQSLFTKMNNKQGLEELHENYIKYYLDSENNFRLVADYENELISTITLMKEEEFKNTKIVHMYAVVTKKEFQGTGISGHFFEFACGWAKKIGGTRIKLSTKKDNIRAQKFYEKMGCLNDGEEEDEIVYIKELSSKIK